MLFYQYIYWFILILNIVLCINCEQDIKYNVNFLNPTLDLPTGDQIEMLTKDGRIYTCIMPYEYDIGEDVLENLNNKEKQQQIKKQINDKIWPIKNNCMKRSNKWWTYELCMNSHLKQYHVEADFEIEVVIGIVNKEYNEEQKKDKPILNTFEYPPDSSEENIYYSEYLSDGDICDLTNEPRTAEIRYVCFDTKRSYIYDVIEPEPCSYIVIVNISSLCSTSLFNQDSGSSMRSVSCKIKEYNPNIYKSTKPTPNTNNNDIFKNKIPPSFSTKDQEDENDNQKTDVS
eukprot:TRINITY_DN13178_c0_g1_i1.p1 TRINITY_DN13178_c0_g1~~TRINITY_DN13178_c0_g1_i1.p1  ORF type:complete len:287 (+),score=48.97 TRINITY_DN13178_c0_g1_i1:136-996(+)